MSTGNTKPAWQTWHGLVVICAAIVIAQSISTYYLAQHQLDSEDISAVLDSRKPRGGRGGVDASGSGRRGGGGGGLAGRGGREPQAVTTTTPTGAATWEQAEATEASGDGVAKVMDDLDGSERWSLESSDAVQRWDSLMQKRVERVAQQQGIDPATVMPSTDLRERALASDDLRSEEAQELIAEYSRILRELGQSQE
jgi:hypothetical protein